jgi:hypothetical protein
MSNTILASQQTIKNLDNLNIEPNPQCEVFTNSLLEI